MSGRYFELLDPLRQAAIATDPAGRITGWSRAAAKLYGWKARETIGRNILDVTPSAISRAQAAAIMTALAAGEVWSGTFDVQRRDGTSFAASVTDVPQIDGDRVAGIVGISAPAGPTTRIVTAVKQFAAACDAVWPKQVKLHVALRRPATVAASEPHFLQLLTLLLMRYADALDRGALVDVHVRATTDSVFSDFQLAATPALYVRIGPRNRRRPLSLLRDELRFAKPTNYAANLVRLVSGMLLAETAGRDTRVTHLALPME